MSYLAGSNIQFSFLDMTSPIVGAVFCLIIVRVTLGMSVRTFDIGTATALNTGTGTASWSRRTDSDRSQGGFRLSPIRVNVHKHVDIGDGRKDLALPASDGEDGEVALRYASSLDASLSHSQFESA